MSAVVHVLCDHCCRELFFEKGACGTAWLRVEVQDGGSDDPLIIAQFCCPQCCNAFLSDPNELGTITFPEPRP